MLTPSDIFGVPLPTPEAYRLHQRRFLARTRTGAPHDATATPEMVLRLSDDSVRVKCACGDFAVVHPDWRLGLCLLCGAVYDDVPMPELD